MSNQLPHGLSPAVIPWLEANIAGATGPFDFTMIAGGHSNLTFGVVDGNGRKYVLRRPPLGHVLASAHDMGREHRIIAALSKSNVPVAPALGFCDDPAVNDAPFYVMSFVDGHVIRDTETATHLLTVPARRDSEEVCGCFGVANDVAIDERHDVEGRIVHGRVIAETESRSNGNVRLAERGDDAMLATHVVGTCKNVSEWWPTQHVLPAVAIDHAEREVRVASGDHGEVEGACGARNVRLEPRDDGGGETVGQLVAHAP